MCNVDSIVWVSQHLSLAEVRGKRILEVGSYDTNGNIRSVVEALRPAEYTGIDARTGPGVDQVCFAENLVSRYGSESFDMVLSIATLEHVRDWQKAVSNIKNICKPLGLIFIVVPSNWYYHPFPYDYWRFSLDDLFHIFADCEILDIAEDPQTPSLVYLKARKPSHFLECDLSGYSVYSVKAQKRMRSARTLDLFSRQFTGIRFENVGELILLSFQGFFRFLLIGLQVRVLKPAWRLLQYLFGLDE